MLSTMILLLDGSCSKNAIISDFSGNSYIPKSFAIFYNLNSPLWKLSSVSAIMTWSSANEVCILVVIHKVIHSV
jgi:hypothetical protein